VEKRYRQRHLDLIVSPQTRETFRRRAKLVSCIRRWLDEREISGDRNPRAQCEAGGADARRSPPTTTPSICRVFLRIATELHLKRLVVGASSGSTNSPHLPQRGHQHPPQPEFTSVEVYQAYADYTDMMALTEALIAEAAQQVCGSTQIAYQGTPIDLTPPWRRATMHELVGARHRPRFQQLRAAADSSGRDGRRGLEVPAAADSVGRLLTKHSSRRWKRT